MSFFSSLRTKTAYKLLPSFIHRHCVVFVDRKPYRRAFQIYVDANGELHTVCALRTPLKEIKSFLNKHWPWVQKQREEQKKRRRQYPTKTFREGEEFLFQGKKHYLKYQKANHQTLLQNLVKQNSVKQNSVKQNSVKQNLVKQNSVKQNSVKQNSVKQNLVKQNLVKQNSVKQNSVKQNSVKQNSVKQNLVKQNSVKQNSVKQNLVKQNSIKTQHPIVKQSPLDFFNIQQNNLVYFWRNGEDLNDTALKQRLREFYQEQGVILIQQAVEKFSSRMRLFPKTLRIGAQKSLWGACSSAGRISLNWRLVVAPAETLHYVVIHELAHLKHLNHSPPFWSLVAEFCPDYKQHEHWLKKNSGATDFLSLT